jgi:hypothetical protein
VGTDPDYTRVGEFGKVTLRTAAVEPCSSPGEMNVQRICFLGTRTSNFDATAAFFGGVLGLDSVRSVPGWSIFQLPSARGDYVEVFGPEHRNASVFPTEIEDGILVAFAFDDIVEAREELAAADVELIGDLVWAAELTGNPEMEGYGWFFLHGSDDNIVPLDRGRALAAGIPSSKLVIVEGSDKAATRLRHRKSRFRQSTPFHAPAKPEKERFTLQVGVPITDAPIAIEYLEKRGIPLLLAEACHLRFTESWLDGGPAVLFPIVQQDLTQVALHGRYTSDKTVPKAKTKGPKSLGVFTTPEALTASTFAITEGLSMPSPWLHAVCLLWRWLARILPRDCEERSYRAQY